MPNWCFCKLTVYGPSEEVNRFANEASTMLAQDEDERSEISLQKLVPCPPILLGRDHAANPDMDMAAYLASMAPGANIPRMMELRSSQMKKLLFLLLLLFTVHLPAASKLHIGAYADVGYAEANEAETTYGIIISPVQFKKLNFDVLLGVGDVEDIQFCRTGIGVSVRVWGNASIGFDYCNNYYASNYGGLGLHDGSISLPFPSCYLKSPWLYASWSFL